MTDVAAPVDRRLLTAGEVATYRSHMRLWEHIAGLDVPCALALEDDAILTPDIRRLLARWRYYPRDMDVCNLVVMNRRVDPGRSWRRRYRLYDRTWMVRVLGHPWGTAAILIRPRAAAALVAAGTPIRHVIDAFWSPWLPPRLRVYTTRPAIAFHPPHELGGSLVERERARSVAADRANELRREAASRDALPPPSSLPARCLQACLGTKGRRTARSIAGQVYRLVQYLD